MKYVCLGYYNKGEREGMTGPEQDAMYDACFDYDEHLRANGHWAWSYIDVAVAEASADAWSELGPEPAAASAPGAPPAGCAGTSAVTAAAGSGFASTSSSVGRSFGSMPRD